MTSVAARFFILASLLAVGLGACVPTAARKNARLTQGVGADISVGAQIVEAGENEDGSPTAGTGLLHAELDIEYAHKGDDGSGVALQLKIPWTIVFSSVDVFYQLPENDSKWFFGFGAELGALTGVYAVATHYVKKDMYLSLTPRVLNATERGQRAVLINPQISVGMLSGPADLSLFASFAHHTGDGFDFHVELFGGEPEEDYRKNYWLMGGSARF